jgi:hypothetical protein
MNGAEYYVSNISGTNTAPTSEIRASDITVQYSATNVMHFLFSLLRIKGHYMLGAAS